MFDALAGYDPSLRAFRDRAGSEVDLRDPEHGHALLVWLNHWGCRHLATSCHAMATSALADWHQAIRGRLPPTDHRLASIPDGELDDLAGVFDSLCSRTGAKRTQGREEQEVSFGPTATAKTLFALRPHVFIPWDEAMRQELRHDGSGASYVAFLKEARDGLVHLENECRAYGIDLDSLPERFGRPHSTVAQLIDEYHWITITRRVTLPSRRTLKEWLAWS